MPVTLTLVSRLKSPVRGVSGPALPAVPGAGAWWHARLYPGPGDHGGLSSGSASSDMKGETRPRIVDI